MSMSQNTTILAKILLAIFLLGWMIMYIVIGHEFFKSIGVSYEKILCKQINSKRKLCKFIGWKNVHNGHQPRRL